MNDYLNSSVVLFKEFLSRRWAQVISGKDETGRERVLALDWDGRWHDLSPGQVQPKPRTQRADQFNVGDYCLHDGRAWTRVKSNLSIEQIVFAAEDDPHVGLIAAADAEMEVAPCDRRRPRSQRADQFNVGDLAVADGVILRRIKSDVSIGSVAFVTEDEETAIIVDAAAELEVAP